MTIQTIFFWVGIVSITAIIGGLIGFSLYIFIKKMTKIKNKTKETDLDAVYKTIRSLDNYSPPKKVERQEQEQEQQQQQQTIKTDVPDAESIKPYDIKTGQFMSGTAKRKMKKILKKFQESAVYIVFQTSNNKFKTWVQEEENGGFTYKKKMYLFDKDNQIHFIDMQMYGYFFQEQINIPVNKHLKLSEPVQKLINAVNSQIQNEFSLPIEKLVNINEVKQSIEAYGLAEVESAFEPESLKRFIDTQVILQVMGGAWFTKIMKIVLILNIVMIFFIFIDVVTGGYGAFTLYKLSQSLG